MSFQSLPSVLFSPSSWLFLNFLLNPQHFGGAICDLWTVLRSYEHVEEEKKNDNDLISKTPQWVKCHHRSHSIDEAQVAGSWCGVWIPVFVQFTDMGFFFFFFYMEIRHIVKVLMNSKISRFVRWKRGWHRVWLFRLAPDESKSSTLVSHCGQHAGDWQAKPRMAGPHPVSMIHLGIPTEALEKLEC